jgi:hypothetical protein
MILSHYLLKPDNYEKLIDDVALAKMNNTYCDTCKKCGVTTIANVDEHQEVQMIGKRIKAICISCLYKEVYE